MNKNIKVVWICEFSNKFVRTHLHFRYYNPFYLYNIIRQRNIFRDLSQWITNGIYEFEKFGNIELHIISPHPYLLNNIEVFSHNRINYHFFKSEDDSFINQIKRRLKIKQSYQYKKNSTRINFLVRKINPDIIHLIGAENPHYSISVLEMERTKPLLVSLQTLMSDPDFYGNYPINNEIYQVRSQIEKDIINKADYIGTSIKKFTEIIKLQNKKDFTFLNIKLAINEQINTEPCEKSYDFVYFAKEIEKAVDWVIEAFALAIQKNPNFKLLIIGGYNNSFKIELDKIIEKHGISSNITFTNTLPTHEDVLNSIRKAKIALLPLKIDFISGTIREAIANGLPVITTKTAGTPILNKKRDSILISEPNDFKDIANNMIKLTTDTQYAETLKKNAFITLNEMYNNSEAMKKWVLAYKAIVDNFHLKKNIPENLITF